MAARLGRDPKVIIRKLRELNKLLLLPNMLYDLYGGCLENCPVFATTLNEMAMQSFEGIIRIFPVWDKSVDCKFKNLRADGAFLVSAEMKGGRLMYAEILSEAGESLTLENPYAKARVMVDGKVFETEERFITLKTEKGSRIIINE